MLLVGEDGVADHKQKRQCEQDYCIPFRRHGICPKVGPVVAVADVGAMARVEACAPNQVQAAQVDRAGRWAQG